MVLYITKSLSRSRGRGLTTLASAIPCQISGSDQDGSGRQQHHQEDLAQHEPVPAFHVPDDGIVVIHPAGAAEAAGTRFDRMAWHGWGKGKLAGINQKMGTRRVSELVGKSGPSGVRRPR